MALAVAASPSRVTSGSGSATVTTASFTPPANSLLVACLCGNALSTNFANALAATFSSTPALTWTERVKREGSESGSVAHGIACIATAVVTTSQAYTVTVSTSNSPSTGPVSLKVYVVTGADTVSPIGAVGENSSTTNNLTPNVYTSTSANSLAFGCAIDWNANGSPVSTDTEDPFTNADISGLSAFKAAVTGTVGTVVTMNFDAAGASPAEWNWAAVEVKAGGGGAVDLTTNAATQLQVADAPALTQLHGTLTVADAIEAQTADVVALTQVHDLTVADAVEAQTSTTPTLVLAGDPGVVPWVRDARHGGTGGTNTALNHSVPIPTCVVGDDLWASFTLNGGHGAVTEPSGWTRVFPTTITDDGFMTLLIYRKTATSTEVAGGNITTVVATAVRGNSGSMAIVGADTAAAPDGVVSSTSTGGTTSVSQTVVASTDNSLILSILGLDSATEDPTPTAPLVQWWNPMESGIIGQGNAGAAVHRPTAGSASYGWTWTSSVARKAWAASIRSVAVASLTVADASQAQTSDNVALTEVHVLTVADASQAQTSTTVTVALGGALTVDDAGQPQVAGSPALTQLHGTLTVADAIEAQTADAPALTQLHGTLTVADASEAQTADVVALTQVHDLTVAAATQAQTADTVTVTGAGGLAAADAVQLQTADAPTLTQLSVLTVDAAVQTQTSASPTLIDPGTSLTINEPVQLQVAGSPTLTQLHTLAVDAAIQVLTSAAVPLVQLQGPITVAAAVQAQTAGVPSLTQVSLVRGSMAATARTGLATAGGGATTQPAMAATLGRSAPTMTGG